MNTLLKYNNGLNAFQLKLIALVTMTIDHLAAFGFEIPVFAAYYTPLRIIGRIAAPVFLFLLVQSARHARNRKKFLLRLYLAGAATGLFTTAANFFMGEAFGYFTPGNIIFTFFFTVLYIHLAEMLLDGWKTRNLKNVFLAFALFAISFLPNLLWDWFSLPAGAGIRCQSLAEGLRNSFLPANLHGDLDYGLPFILLGVVLYFVKTKKRQCWVFAGFCLLCFMGWGASLFVSGLHSISYFATFCNSIQLWMVLALPFMYLYNGQRGPSAKVLFYGYYPLHRYAIFLITTLCK